MPEIFFSSLPSTFSIETISPAGRFRAKLVDLVFGSLEEDYPAVNYLLLRFDPRHRWGSFPGDGPLANGGGTRLRLPLAAIEWVEWGTGQFRVHNPGAFQMVELGTEVQDVLLKRDILDNFIIDLQNKRVTRANDLLLEDMDSLHLKAADTGLRALVRRASGGLYRGFRPEELQDWKYVEFLRGEPDAVEAGAGYHRRIEQLTPGEITHLASDLPFLQTAELVLLLPVQLSADILELLSPERQLQVFEELPEEYAARVLGKMAPDIAADLVGHLKPEDARRFLNRLPREAGERIVDLLRYPEDTVGGIMTNDVVAVPAHWTVAKARDRLRELLQSPDFVYFIYLVDDEQNRNLRGVVTLRSLLVAQDDRQLEEIMNPHLVTLLPLDSPKQAAYRLLNNQLAALPVVSREGRLLGAVTIDEAVNLVAPSNWSSQAPRIFS